MPTASGISWAWFKLVPRNFAAYPGQRASEIFRIYLTSCFQVGYKMQLNIAQKCIQRDYPTTNWIIRLLINIESSNLSDIHIGVCYSCTVYGVTGYLWSGIIGIRNTAENAASDGLASNFSGAVFCLAQPNWWTSCLVIYFNFFLK